MNTLTRPQPAATPPPAPEPVAAAAVRRAEALLAAARATQSGPERREAARLGRMMGDAPGKAFTLAMVDQIFRSRRPALQAKRWRRLLRRYGVPRYLNVADRALMSAGSLAGSVAPGVVLPLVEKRLRADSSRVILDAAPGPLHRYLADRRAGGFRVNLNQLGEAVLGEEEAARRLDLVLKHLADPAVDYISVKLSAVFSQINLLAWDATLTSAKDRLRRLYRAALPDRKFVNLDMEEYRDLALTLAAFRELLDEPDFAQLSAGVVLQAYLPDSWLAQRELTAWARGRVARGGAPIKIRLVKGANLAMEAVEAEQHGWHPAPYATKAETDANFRRMLEFGCRPENAAAARLGVATHNLFDAALALELRERFGTRERVELEMLEGMANHQARAARDAAGGLLLYAPAVADDDFLSAMAYLVRRLDENTAPENYLRASFAMTAGSPEWDEQRARFERGWAEREAVSDESRRSEPAAKPEESVGFENEPDTDWTQARHRDALRDALAAYRRPELPPAADADAVRAALAEASAAQPAWESLGIEHRAAVLRRVGRLLSAERFATLAVLNDEGKKTVAEADGEVSEAVDFARYYADSHAIPASLRAEALGVVAVVPPWNFPYAIPCGGVLAALAAGNSVVLKPAPETAGIAWHLAQQLWRAGVPRGVLQYVRCDDGDAGKALITDPRTAAVVLTGSTETAKLFLGWRPALRLYAETSGKNAIVVTAQADRELAIKDAVKSAFGHAGQKCSAASLLICEAEVYDDPAFRRQLRDAAASLFVGPASDPRSVVTPLMRAPEAALMRALTTLDDGEEWLLEPKNVGEDPCLWSPGIRLGVRPGSWFHRTECFGPVLGVMRADSLEQATEWQNATPFGLTAGLHSLDDAEQAWWLERVQAGNLYVNRPITGAVVRRQPFGGWKASSVGPGAKAGGPNYTLLFTTLSDSRDERPDYDDAWRAHFAPEHDPSELRGESNVLRYRPCRGVILRTANTASVGLATQAAQVAGVETLIASSATQEGDDRFIARLPTLANRAEFLRSDAPLPDALLRAAHAAGLNVIVAPLTACGRSELRFWVREQSVTVTRHRYGQIPGWKPAER